MLDLLGAYLVQRPEYVQKYYAIIASRLTDPGVSVRKRVIKILKHICVACTKDGGGGVSAPAGTDTADAGTSCALVGSPLQRSPPLERSSSSVVPTMSARARAIDACCLLVTRLGPSEEEEVQNLILVPAFCHLL